MYDVMGIVLLKNIYVLYMHTKRNNGGIKPNCFETSSSSILFLSRIQCGKAIVCFTIFVSCYYSINFNLETSVIMTHILYSLNYSLNENYLWLNYY